MAVMDSVRLRGLKVQESVHQWIGVGFLLYLGALFFCGGSQQKTFFYLLVALPALFLLFRSKQLFRQDRWAISSVVLMLVYYSLSTLWSGGEGDLKDALKYSLYIYLLMLGIEATTQRFSSPFIQGYIVVAGGIAACSYFLAMLLGDTPLSTFVTGRFSLEEIAGWGTGNPINSGVIFGIMALAAWWLLPGKKWSVQVLLVLMIASAAALMFVSKSRGPMLSLTVVVLLITLFRRSKIDVLVLLLGIVSLAGALLLSNLDAVVADRVAVPNYRDVIWAAVFEQFKSHWLFGAGLGNDANIAIANGMVVTHSHSSLFEAFRTGGLVGGLMLIGMIFLLLRHSVRRPAGYFFLLWFMFGVMCLLTNGRTLIVKPSVEWIAFWLPLFLLYFATRPGLAHGERA